MSEIEDERESLPVRAWGEFVGLVGLVGDVLADCGMGLQNWSARAFAKSLSRTDERDPNSTTDPASVPGRDGLEGK